MHTPIFIVGPTACGKSALALSIARREARAHGPDRFALLCLDAMQIYRGASIGTSKPTAAEQAELPHGGVDLLNLGESFSVADYLRHAAQFLEQNRERQVLIVGGTGLYFRALTRGLCLAPEVPAELRDQLNALSIPELQERLQKLDPLIYSRLDVNNPRRLVRALEVVEFTGRSLAQWQAETPPPLIPRYHAYLLQRPRDELRDRIEQRVHAMMQAGWVAEVKQLLAQHGPEPVLQFAAIGYRNIAEHLLAHPHFAVQDTLPDKLVTTIVQETQQYAKRQLTWFAREPSLSSLSMTKDLESTLFNQRDAGLNKNSGFAPFLGEESGAS